MKRNKPASVQGHVTPVVMNSSNIKHDLAATIGNLLTHGPDGQFSTNTPFGSFNCAIEKFDSFAIVERTFETTSESVDIPFSCYQPSVQMIFSFDGYSLFNRRLDPFKLAPTSQCINFFQGYDCTNLLPQKTRQHDLTFRLSKGFYSDLVAQHLSSADDRLATMIAKEKEFNTINQHIPIDAAVSGILQNIMQCPYKGDMRIAFIREHVRALLTLQLFHFDPIVTGTSIVTDSAISRRDREILQDIKCYIDLNFLNPHSIESLSKDFGLNEFKLKHGFKKLFGASPIRYLQQRRLSFAFDLIRDTDRSIKEIADEIGYAHAANFTAAFTKAFGNPPQHFRSQNNKASEIYAGTPYLTH